MMSAQRMVINRPSRYKRLWLRIRRRWGLYLLLLIPVVYVFIFNYVPMYGVTIAFKRYRIKSGIMGSPWVGFYQFERLFSNVKFTQILGNTLRISLYSLLAGFPVPILLAIGLTHLDSNRYRRTVQMVTYAPHFLSTVVIVGLINQLFSIHSGIVNRLMDTMGIEKINYLGKADYFRHMYVWSGKW